MATNVNLYDNAYQNYAAEAYRCVRTETYGEDLGQTSWVTTEESNEIPRLLELTRASTVLEIGCGSGQYALKVAATVGCRLVGMDVNTNGVHNANELARANQLDSRVNFQQGDASQPLPFGDGTFEAAFANDVMCHVPGRANAVKQIQRVLKPGGLFLFSDALVIGGIVSHTEIATRSSIGFYLFSPPGENERLLSAAGFSVLAATDTTPNVAAIAKKWNDSREKWKAELIAAEGEENFQGVQRFLACVHTVSSEGRLRRYLYLARKYA
jgi:SAM-dependent methyltransferase